MKQCTKCLEKLSLTDFNKTKRSKDGYMYFCKKCHYIQVKANRNNYKEYDKKYADDYNKLNQQNIKEKQKNWRLNNPDYYKIKRNNEREKFNYYDNQYKKNKRINDINFKLKDCISSNINFNLKKYKNDKTDSYINYLGCTIEYYVDYLSPYLKPEMDWGNYGIIWEIDHIVPISTFDMSVEENIYKAFNYNNTQPLFKTTEIAVSFGYNDEIGNRNKYNKLII
jgi:hypothetical protein